MQSEASRVRSLDYYRNIIARDASLCMTVVLK